MSEQKKKKKGFFQEFKAFISRGNILDLAVGVIIGSAFGKIVTSLTNDIIMPLIALAMGKSNISELSLVLRAAELNEAGEVITEALTWNWGAFLQTIMDFLIIAFVLFLIVKIMMRVKSAHEKLVEGVKDLAEKIKNDDDEKKSEEDKPVEVAEASVEQSAVHSEKKE